jgi:hypothetical protein
MTSTCEKGPASRWIDLITWSPVPALIVVYAHGDLADVYSSNRLPKIHHTKAKCHNQWINLQHEETQSYPQLL